LIILPTKVFLKGTLSTVELLVPTSLDQILSTLKILCTFLQNKLTWWGDQLYWAFPVS